MRKLLTHSSRSFLAGGLLALGLLHVRVTAIWAQEVVVVDFAQAKDGVPSGWELSEHEGKADLALVNDSDGQVLRLRSASASFALKREVDVDLKKTPILEWQWKVTEVPKGGNFFRSATDDQAGQLIVAFSWRKFITYIWDSTVPAGTVGDAPSPPLRTVRAVVVQSGEKETGKWVTETRNVAEDYKRLFGEDPDKAVGVCIQINSQHTKSNAEVYWKRIRFKAQTQ
ncbi:MAG: DUF3047 domain-containing protein [Candidatus Methylomirabilales bacterium]